MRLLVCDFQIGDLKGLFGLLMVNMQLLRAKLKVVDVSYGHGTGNLCYVIIY
jgi:carotenoid cleavage dioxygenase